MTGSPAGFPTDPRAGSPRPPAYDPAAGPTPDPTLDPGGADRAWAWVAHLREGGTTPWRDFRGTSGERPHGVTGGVPGALPGAQQLELLRRLNLAGRPSQRLTERVLAASAPGRGQADLELVGAGPVRRFGARPVDPADLPQGELVRVATSLLAEDLVATGPRPVHEGFPRPWRVRYQLAGDPLRGADLRAHLTRRGRAPGGPLPIAVVLGGPVDRLVAAAWSRRSFEHGVERWHDFLDRWQQRRHLPPRVDVAEIAERMAARHGWEHVRVVVDPAELPATLGVRRLPAWREPGADVVELGRRIAAVVGLLVPSKERAALLSTTLWRAMPRTNTAPIAVPEEYADWLDAMARRTATRLRRGGYPVVGDLAGLAPVAVGDPGPAGLPERVLDLALRMLLDDGWAEVPR